MKHGEKMRDTVTTEINSTTDNPLFDFSKKEATGGILFAGGGNFHGQSLATVIDYLKLSLTGIGLMSDKRTLSQLDERLSYGLPSSLAYDLDKADGGLMVAQYAGAARAAASRVLSTPASVMSLTTSAGQEDFVSMGSIGVLHLHKIIYNTQIVLAIEILCALRALQLTYHKLPKKLRTLGKGTTVIYNYLNEVLPPVKGDRYLRTDIEAVRELVRSGQLVQLVERFLST